MRITDKPRWLLTCSLKVTAHASFYFRLVMKTWSLCLQFFHKYIFITLVHHVICCVTQIITELDIQTSKFNVFTMNHLKFLSFAEYMEIKLWTKIQVFVGVHFSCILRKSRDFDREDTFTRVLAVTRKWNVAVVFRYEMQYYIETKEAARIGYHGFLFPHNNRKICYQKISIHNMSDKSKFYYLFTRGFKVFYNRRYFLNFRRYLKN